MSKSNRTTCILAACKTICFVAACTSPGAERSATTATRKYHEVYGNAMNLYRQGKVGKAHTYLDSAYATFTHVPAIARYLRLTYKSWVHYNERHFDSANVYADSALAQMRNNNITALYPDDYIHALLEKGRVLMALQQNEMAYDYYLMAKDFARSNVRTRNVHELSYDMGMMLYRQRRYAEAAESFRNGYNEASALLAREGMPYAWANPIYRMQEMLANAGLCYTRTKQYDSALHYYRMALTFIDTSKHHMSSETMANAAKGVVLGNMGTAYLQHGDTVRARELYQKSIELNLQPGGDLMDALKTTIKLSELSVYEGRMNEVPTLLHKADLPARAGSRPDVERNYTLLMSQYYDKAGNELLANRYFKRYVYLRDSIDAATHTRDNSDIRNYLAQKEQQHRIELLERDNHIGRLLNVAVLLFALLVSGVVVVVVISYRRSRRNVAALAGLNKHIEWQKQQLEQKNREKDRLLSAVAHDLRNPVGSIKFITDQMTEGQEPPLIPNDVAMTIVHNAANTAMELIDELNEYGPAAPQNIEKVPIDMKMLIGQCADMLQHRAAEKKQVIECLMPACHVIVPADAGKIKRVLINLVSNAIKFSDEGGHITILLQKNNNEAVIEVSDNGIGIPAEMMNHLFDMFTPARRKGTAGEHSFGLGLSISMQIANAHGGHIAAQSAEGCGSTFSLRLPLQ